MCIYVLMETRVVVHVRIERRMARGMFVLSLGEQNCSGKQSRALARRIESTRDWTDA